MGNSALDGARFSPEFSTAEINTKEPSSVLVSYYFFRFMASVETAEKRGPKMIFEDWRKIKVTSNM